MNEGNPIMPSPAYPQIWECPAANCMAAARTVDSKIPYHLCPEQNGVMVPLVHVGTRAVHRLIERPDNVGSELIQRVQDRRGRLVMAVETHRDDGFDTAVFAPTARTDIDPREMDADA